MNISPMVDKPMISSQTCLQPETPDIPSKFSTPREIIKPQNEMDGNVTGSIDFCPMATSG